MIVRSALVKVGHRQTNPSKSALNLKKTQGAFTSTTQKTNADNTENQRDQHASESPQSDACFFNR